MNPGEKRQKLASFARQIAAPGGQLESMMADDSESNPMYAWVERAKGATDKEREIARRAVPKLVRNEALTPDEEFIAEAIVLPEGRPVVDVVNGTYTKPEDPWGHLDGAPFRARIEAAIPAIGRVEIPEHPSLPYAGTGFVVGDGLLMTNRHVAELFVQGLGLRELKFRPGIETVGIDFRRELGSSATSFFEVKQILMVHPFWDMALLRVTGLAGVAPLVLDAVPAEELRGREVAVIGYPAQDPRNDLELQNRIFRGKFRVKRLQPGTLTGPRATRSFGHDVPALTHNSSTLGGNSGSAIVDVKTGEVLGLHFGGVYLDANYAVPAYELSRDRHVVDAGVKFTKTHVGSVSWASYWDESAPARPAAGPNGSARKPAPRPGRSTPSVFDVTVPLRVTFSLDAPVLGARLAIAANGGATASGAHVVVPVSPPATGVDWDDALARAREKEAQPYYDADADAEDVLAYYEGIQTNVSAAKLFDALNERLLETHEEQPRYKPSEWVYPWVDRQKNGRIRSIYSASGRTFTLEEILALDAAVEHMRQERIAELPLTEASSEAAIEAIEAALPFNCEHVVPQSWFTKKEPMRGDLHHLFACESGCNSFRGNRAYFSFGEEAVREDCGESSQNKFEPGAGKGAVARATLYFLVRYPKQVSSPSEMPADRLATLKKWHQDDPVTEWERHRNQAIFAIQGNRNPFIDHPEWVGKVDFRRGLRTGGGEQPDEGVLEVLR